MIPFLKSFEIMIRLFRKGSKMQVLLIVLLLLLLFGGGLGGYHAWGVNPYYGGGIGLGALLIIVVLILLLTGRL